MRKRQHPSGMTGIYQQLHQLLRQLESEMRVLDLWGDTPPPPEAMASKMPFCYDTMGFNDWLQWVFIDRMSTTIDQGLPLPERCEIAPLAEVLFAEQMADKETANLLALIREIDRLISNPNGAG